MKVLSVIVGLALAAVSQAADMPALNFTSCAPSTTGLTLTALPVLEPYPLCIGKEYCLTLTGQLNTDITQGSRLSVIGRWVGRIVYTDNQDLCTLLAAQGTPCPVASTTSSIKLCTPMKSNFWANVQTHFQFSATNGDGDLLFCQTSPIYAQNCA
ncbi:hypothetical protein BX616_006783 [Lobosporangium transversale]|uniref:Phosphatidylglycerol/phosphatidylinositol transfer protein n=1 Tax=Lobosporangium transversale TaxID=64571 RepID=A0A1Y2H0S3_9FUNG|nr:hypothetical protein BCR41DRAFT_392650 [Lobosporangium transversale]KAF9915159.1 hypothetical protein BX616_006783 [Lobosporangium transversale]ORZ27323.1 hypothetical protein BCR41DRAFT_392650 [Lobosporangium transversale]|eukprot:XP_021885050.1 hypothetical protein BCR41DRAFT_392650 [Lobosporangium transversale]